MIPFSRWVETVSEPQDKAGEKALDLDKVVEKRLMMMIDDMSRDGKGSRQEIIKAVQKLVNSVGNQQQPGNQQGGGQQQGQVPPETQQPGTL